ncbi:hypothetical protein [Aliikangiella maris]|uniref:Uncharacterized protein n=2 Tax=Aliikangiella maris TaxID=3162458 RepID=A0ABV3MVE5_9GAMM
MKSNLGLINLDNLQSDEHLVLTIDYEMSSNKRFYLIIKGNYLIVAGKYFSKLKKIWRSNQREFPLQSLPWIVDRIENVFWKKPADGGLSDFERSVSNEFEGEKVGVNVMMHCCSENMHGFNIWNSIRKDYIADIPPHEWNIPDYMLKDGLL